MSRNADSAESPALWAALDLGSNSFHLLLAKPSGDSFLIVERLKEKVQLLAGFQDGTLDDRARARGLACLARFAQRCAGVPREQILIMGTHALRRDTRSDLFAASVQALFAAPLRVISGVEEAQLIYGAVTHQLPLTQQSRLVIDIGGGSTELSFGTQQDIRHSYSVEVGCVAFKESYFGAGAAPGYAAAKEAALAALAEIATQPDVVPQEVYGTSGTIESIATVLEANGWSGGEITAAGLQRLEQAIIDERWVFEVAVPGLPMERVDIFPGGVAILAACFETFNLTCLEYVDVTLLQGMLVDALVGTTTNDIRAASVRALANRCAVDAMQAQRVERCIADFIVDLRTGDDPWIADDETENMLRWAAELHEIGIHISAKHYHRHSSYILQHASLPGFTPRQRRELAILLRSHRRSLPLMALFNQVTGTASEKSVGETDRQGIKRLALMVALLRLAVILNRGHVDEPRQWSLRLDAQTLVLSLGPGWLESHPLSARELEYETDQLQKMEWQLVVC